MKVTNEKFIGHRGLFVSVYSRFCVNMRFFFEGVNFMDSKF